MAQLDDSKQPSNGFGFFEKVTFGKYYDKSTKKGLNVYEIANAGDFKYLNWIINHKPKKGEAGAQEFKICETLRKHAQAAMRLSGLETKWEEVTEPTPDSQRFVKYWQTSDKQMKGPDIFYTVCGVCGNRKNSVGVQKRKNKWVCNKCALELF